MNLLGEKLSLGVEEEYLLVEAESRALAVKPPPEFMEGCKRALGPRVVHEFLQSQIEVVTDVCATASEVREQLVECRSVVAEVACRYDLRMVAASTHPWSEWSEQESTDLERYRMLRSEQQAVARRLSICGMHVHAGIEDKDLRVDVMAQMSYFMPHLLALSTSSPFWEGLDTGLKAFRPVIAGDLPHSGFPEVFERWNDWLELISILAETGITDDPSKIWWDLRPSANHPTLELRICDVCTRIEDCLTIVALYRSILAYLIDLRSRNETRRLYRHTLLMENRWRAFRYGIDAEMADYGKRKLVPIAELIDEIIDLVGPYAEELECRDEVERARAILERGTSADRQLEIFRLAVDGGASEREAQVKVVDWLIEQSRDVDAEATA